MLDYKVRGNVLQTNPCSKKTLEPAVHVACGFTPTVHNCLGVGAENVLGWFDSELGFFREQPVNIFVARRLIRSFL